MFVGLIFSANLFTVEMYGPLILGFIGLCLISSANYIINDLRDAQKDRLHPEKSHRPIASGMVSQVEGILLFIVLLALGLSLAFAVSSSLRNQLLTLVLFVIIFVTSQSYTFYFKQKVVYDVIFIALNYIWRAVTGIVIIDVPLSPWLFALGFLFALFLALAKRRGDLILLGDKASEQRSVLKDYNLPLIDQFTGIAAGTIIVSWAIYIIDSPLRADSKIANQNLALLSIPLVTTLVLKLLLMLENDPRFGRRAELLLTEPQILILGASTALVVFFSIYWKNIEDFLLSLL